MDVAHRHGENYHRKQHSSSVSSHHHSRDSRAHSYASRDHDRLHDRDRDLKATAWSPVLDTAYERPKYEQVLARRVCVPLFTGFAVAVVLVLLQPPFVCTSTGAGDSASRPSLSVTRVLLWTLLAAVATAVLTMSKVFRTHNGSM